MPVLDILSKLVNEKATDVFFIAGRPVSYKLGGLITALDDERLGPEESQLYVQQIYRLASNRPIDKLMEKGDDDFSFAINGVSRFRVNAYKQRGSLAAVIRVVPFELPDAKVMNIPKSIEDLADLRYGLVLVSGPAGSGKSTTLATIIDRINRTRNAHIVTLENPIEFLHRHQMSIVSQREVQIDTEDYASALRAAMRQSPNVILIGELRDAETISIALDAAETGHLVLSTVHTLGAVNAVDRILHSFDPLQLAQARMQLSMVLECVVSQQLIQRVSGGVIPAFEIMHSTTAVRNLIREGRTHQLSQVIETSGDVGMQSMDSDVLKLFQEGTISSFEMFHHALEPENLARITKLDIHQKPNE
ncbi:MAG: PilT/PilU family type 4a pilus ATPase [Coriobacteriia bacterium]|nr:PilT/PilU family type 4a pilus ATPase [Coriobacteriia bacterium]